MRRTAVAAAIVGLSVVGLSACTTPSSRFDADGDTEASTEAAATEVPILGDRIAADDDLKLPENVRLNRILNAVSPVNAKATITISDIPGDITIDGRVDPAQGTADLFINYEGDRANIRFVESKAYTPITPEDREVYLADWFEIDLASDTPPPFSVQVTNTVTLRPGLLSSVGEWTDVSTSKDKADKLVHYSGTGATERLLGDVTGMQPDTEVDIWVDSTFFIHRLDWHIPADDSADRQDVKASIAYTKGRTLASVKPKTRIADFSKLQAEAAANDDSATADSPADAAVADDTVPDAPADETVADDTIGADEAQAAVDAAVQSAVDTATPKDTTPRR